MVFLDNDTQQSSIENSLNTQEFNGFAGITDTRKHMFELKSKELKEKVTGTILIFLSVSLVTFFFLFVIQ